MSAAVNKAEHQRNGDRAVQQASEHLKRASPEALGRGRLMGWVCIAAVLLVALCKVAEQASVASFGHLVPHSLFVGNSLMKLAAVIPN